MIEMLTRLLTIIAEAVIARSYLEYVFEGKISALARTATYVAAYGTYFVMYQFFGGNPVFNTIGYVIVNIIIITIGYESSAKISAFHSGLLTVTMTLSELTGMLLMSLFVNDIRTVLLVPRVDRMTIILEKSINLFFVSIERVIFRKENRTGPNISAWLFGFAALFTAFTLLSFDVLLTGDGITEQQEAVFMVFAAAILSIVFIIDILYLYYSKREKELYFLRLQHERNAILTDEYEAMEDLYKKQRILIHDIRHHISILQGLIRDNRNDKAIEYIDGLQEAEVLREQIHFSKNIYLNQMMREFHKKCCKKDISVSIDIREQSEIWLKTDDLVALIGNLLDNALGAAQKNHGAFIDVQLKVNDTAMYVSLENTADEKSTSGSVNRINKENARKGLWNTHGTGIESIKHIVKKYHGEYDADYDAESHVWTTRIRIIRYA